LNKIIN